MIKDKSRIQSCIDHINTAVDVDPWAKELVIEMAAEILKQLTNSNNTISRQAAIDTEGLDEQIRCEMCRNPMHTDRGCDGNCKYDEKLYERIMQILGERIKPLPSVQPEPQWIPCSERLPDIGKPVLLSEPNDIMIAEYHGNGLPEGVWIVDGIHHYLASIAGCAWMPLPEPYREEGE